MKIDYKNLFLSNNYHDPILLLISSIILQYNCRSSEILSATWNDFIFPHLLILRGKKRSANIIIRDRWIIEEIHKLPRLSPIFIFPTVSYNSLYRFFKRNFGHLFLQYKGRKNYKITHAPRYYYANLVNDPELIKDLLHHRSLRSGHYYNNNIKEH